MNCFEARRALLTDPARLPGDVANHVSQCERCGRFAAQVRTLDMRVADAWSIGTPPGLGDRLKLSGPQRSRAWVPVMGGLALAASVLVAALVIGFPSAQGPGGIDWAASLRRSGRAGPLDRGRQRLRQLFDGIRGAAAEHRDRGVIAGQDLAMPTAQIDQGLLSRHAGQHVHNEAFTSMFDNSMQRRLAIQHAVAGPGDAIRDRPNPPPQSLDHPLEIL